MGVRPSYGIGTQVIQQSGGVAVAPSLELHAAWPSGKNLFDKYYVTWLETAILA